MTILLQIDESKSPGPTIVPINPLRIAAPIIAPHLVNVFNLSYKTGIFPDYMKKTGTLWGERKKPGVVCFISKR